MSGALANPIRHRCDVRKEKDAAGRGEDVPARVEPVDRVERARGTRAFSVPVLLDLPDDFSESEGSDKPKPSTQRRADLSTSRERDAARQKILEPVCEEYCAFAPTPSN